MVRLNQTVIFIQILLIRLLQGDTAIITLLTSSTALISESITKLLLVRILELSVIVMSWATGIQRNVLSLNGPKGITGCQCNLCTQIGLISSTNMCNIPMDTSKTAWTD